MKPGATTLFVFDDEAAARAAVPGGRTWAIAAPHGRELAIQGMTSSINVWMIENF